MLIIRFGYGRCTTFFFGDAGSDGGDWTNEENIYTFTVNKIEMMSLHF